MFSAFETIYQLVADSEILMKYDSLMPLKLIIEKRYSKIHTRLISTIKTVLKNSYLVVLELEITIHLQTRYLMKFKNTENNKIPCNLNPPAPASNSGWRLR